MVKKLSVNDFGIHYEEWPKRKSRTLCRVNIAFSLSKDEIVSDCITKSTGLEICKEAIRRRNIQRTVSHSLYYSNVNMCLEQTKYFFVSNSLLVYFLVMHKKNYIISIHYGDLHIIFWM